MCCGLPPRPILSTHVPPLRNPLRCRPGNKLSDQFLDDAGENHLPYLVVLELHVLQKMTMTRILNFKKKHAPTGKSAQPKPHRSQMERVVLTNTTFWVCGNAPLWSYIRGRGLGSSVSTLSSSPCYLYSSSKSPNPNPNPFTAMSCEPIIISHHQSSVISVADGLCG